MTRISVYHRGQWTDQDHPVPDDNGDGDWDELMNGAGYARSTTLVPGVEDYTVAITVWTNGGVNVQRSTVEDAPGYLIDVELEGSTQPAIGATDIVDLMDLLARWAPVIETVSTLRRRFEREEQRIREKIEATKNRR